MVRIERKPHGKVSYRVKDVYVVGDSLEDKKIALTCAYMLSRGLEKVAVNIEGNYYLVEVSGDKVKVEEISADDTSIRSYISAIETTSPIFLIETPDFEKWEKRFSKSVPTKRIVIYGVLALVAVGVLFTAYQKKKSSQKAEKPPSGPVVIRLDPQEKKRQMVEASRELLRSIARRINELAQGERLRSFQGEVKLTERQIDPNTIQEEVIANVRTTIESVYPVKGSRKVGEFFLREESTTIRPQRVSPLKGDYRFCGMLLLKNGIDLVVPDENRFRGTVRKWKKTKELIENLQQCNIEISAISLSQAGMTLEVVLHEKEKTN